MNNLESPNVFCLFFTLMPSVGSHRANTTTTAMHGALSKYLISYRIHNINNFLCFGQTNELHRITLDRSKALTNVSSEFAFARVLHSLTHSHFLAFAFVDVLVLRIIIIVMIMTTISDKLEVN